MNFIEMTLNLRWLAWAIGTCAVISLFLRRSPRFFRNLREYAEGHFHFCLTLLCLAFFGIATLGKGSQYLALGLNGQDFWLFVDILEQTFKGAPFLTRFAPQGLGFVQHGAVHAMLTWAWAAPLAAMIGSTTTSLLMGPLALALSGWMLGLISRPYWNGIQSLGLVAAFFVSSQVGKIWGYDVHPEAFYPFFNFLWIWALGWNTKRTRWGWLVLASIGFAGIKEDSFLIFGPWIAAGFLILPREKRRALAVSAVILFGVFLAQFTAMHLWKSGSLGPSQWSGLPVNSQVSIEALQGKHLSHLNDLFEIFHSLTEAKGGWFQWIKISLQFFVSRPWISLLILAPWIALSPQFWLLVIPLGIIYATLDGPAKLWNYYSAPFLGAIWYAGVSLDFFSARARKVAQFLSKYSWIPSRPTWTLLAACLLGGTSIQIFIPSQQVKTLHQEIIPLLSCIQDSQKGFVQSHLIRWVPLHQIYTERTPRTEKDWNQIDYVLYSPGVDRFEASSMEIKSALNQRMKTENWVTIGKNCEVLGAPLSIPTGESVLLYVKSLTRHP